MNNIMNMKNDSYSKRIILIRHAESRKNTENQYASIEGLEPLTEKANKQIEALITSIERIYLSSHKSSAIIYTAPEKRCKDTAQRIGVYFNIQSIVSQEICSFAALSTSGQNIAEVHKSNKELAAQVEKYQSGLMSGEEVSWPAGSISILESRVKRFIDYCLVCNKRNIWIVGHKSSITCMAITLMRKYKIYPNDFYGYIDIPVGTGIVMDVSQDTLSIELLRPK